MLFVTDVEEIINVLPQTRIMYGKYILKFLRHAYMTTSFNIIHMLLLMIRL